MASLPTVAIGIVIGLSAPALAQFGSSYIQPIDEFTQGGYTRTFSWLSPAAQIDQPSMNVIGGRRLSSIGIFPPNSSFGSQTAGTVTLDTAGTGTFNFGSTSIATNTSNVLLSYRSASVGNISNLMANLNFPGTHGVAIDFISLTGPVTVQIQLATVGGASGQSVYNGVINPDPNGQPFRFYTTWSQYASQPNFTLTQVDQINVMLRFTTPGVSGSIESIGVSPSPGAAGLLGLSACFTARRRRP